MELYLNNLQIIKRSQTNSFKQLKQIEIDFEKDQFVGEKGAKVIANLIQKNQQIESLKLTFKQNNNLSSLGLSRLSEALTRQINIKQLFLNIEGLNNIDSLGLKDFGECLTQLKHLKCLSFSIWRNQIKDRIKYLMEGIKNLNNLVNLSLSFQRNINLSPSFMKEIQNGIQALSNLKQLSMQFGWQSKIRKEGAQILGAAIQNLKDLESLSIDIGPDNNITGHGLTYISQGIKNLKKLKYLNLMIGYQNQIDDESLKILGLIITQLELLNQVNIQVKCDVSNYKLKFGSGFYYFNKQNINFKIQLNNVDFIQLFRLSEGLRYNNQLKNLQLHIRKLNYHKDVNQLFRRSFQGLKNLEYLNLCICSNFTSLEYIGQSLPYLKNLKNLQIKFQIKDSSENLQDVDQFLLGIQPLTQLQMLKLDLSSQTLINYDGLKHVLQAIQQLKKLKSLELLIKIDDFDKEDNLDLMRHLNHLKQLKKLSLTYLQNRKIKNKCLELIKQPYIQSQNLTKLKLKIDQSAELSNALMVELSLFFKQIQSLESLNLLFEENNIINYDSFRVFSEGLANQINIKKLSLNFKEDNLICSQSVKSLGMVIEKLKNMQKLHLRFNKSKIGQDGIQCLHDGIKNLKQISKINLHITDLSSGYLISLAQALTLVHQKTFYLSCLPSFSFLKSLHNYYIQFIQLRVIKDQVDVFNLFRGLNYFINLEGLWIDFVDSLQDANQIYQFGQTLKNLINLQDLKIIFTGSNIISEDGAQNVSQIINNLKYLKSFYLQIEKQVCVSVNGTIILCKSILDQCNLECLVFKIGENLQFVSECLQVLSESIKKNLNIKLIKIKIIQGSMIDSQAILCLADALKDLNKLEQLNLQIEQTQNLSLESFQALASNLKSKEKRMKKLNININNPYKTYLICLFQQFFNLIKKDKFKDSFEIKDVENSNLKIIKLDIQFISQGQHDLYIQGFSAGLATFSDLEILKLSFKSKVLGLESSKYLGDAIQNLIQLKKLDLEFQENNLNQERSVGIFSGLKNLKCLNQLKLEISQQNKIDEQGAFVLGQSIQHLTNLFTLDLLIGQDNNIQNKGFQSIADSLNHLNQLNQLHITIQENNFISYSPVQTITKNLKKLKQLKNISIQIDEPSSILLLPLIEQDSLNLNIKIENKFIQNFKYLIKDNKVIQMSLCVLMLNLGVEGALYFSQSLQMFSQLQQLDLVIQQNCLGLQGAVYIGEALQNFKKMEKLSVQISNNNIQCQGAEKINNAIGQLINLNELALKYESNNKIQEQGGKTLGNCLVNLVKLTHLQIKISKGNNIKEEGGYEIGQGLRNLIFLTELDLDLHQDNQISLKGVKSIVDSLIYLQKLQHSSQMIDSSNKQFQQNYLKLINLNIEDQANIYILSLIVNNLLGTQIKQKDPPQFQIQLQKYEERQDIKYLQINIPTNSNINQEGIESLGETLRQIKSLQQLDLQLQSNKIEALGAIGLAKGIKMLKNLVRLTLQIANSANIRSQGLIALSISISQLESLQFLSLFIGKNNYIDEAGGIDMGKAFKKLIQLEELKLQIGAYNDIQVTGSKAVFEGIEALKNIKRLSLQIESYGSLIYLLLLNKLPLIKEQDIQLKYFEDIKFDRVDGSIISLKFSIDQYFFDQVQGCIEFSKGLACFKELKQLSYISNSNGLSQVSVIELSKSLSLMTNLEQIKIKSNQNNIIEDIGMTSFSNSLHFLQNIQNINLEIGSKSQIKSEGFSNFIESINNLKLLKTLQLTIQKENEFSFQHFVMIIEDSKNVKELDDIQIKIDNPKHQLLNIQHVMDINLQKLTQLKNFSLIITNLNEFKDLQLNKNFLETLPLLQNLSRLQLQIDSQNNLGINGIKQISKSISKLKNLETIDIDFNDKFNILFIEILDYLPQLKIQNFKIQNIQIDECQIVRQNDIHFQESLISVLSITLNFDKINNFEVLKEFINCLSLFKKMVKLTIHIIGKANNLITLTSQYLQCLNRLYYLNLRFPSYAFYVDEFALKDFNNLIYLDICQYLLFFYFKNLSILKKKNLRLVVIK